MTRCADIGRELAALWQEHNDLDEASLEAFKKGQESKEHRLARRRCDALTDRIHAFQALMENSRAVDARDILAQVILAAGHANVIATSEPDEATRKLSIQVEKLLKSVVAAMEQLHGLDRDDYAGEVYASRRLDPHLMEDVA